MIARTPTVNSFRAVYGAMCADWCRERNLAEFDRMVEVIKADALRGAAKATRGEAVGEPHAGATFTAHADWLEERADRIEEEASNE